MSQPFTTFGILGQCAVPDDEKKLVLLGEAVKAFQKAASDSDSESKALFSMTLGVLEDIPFNERVKFVSEVIGPSPHRSEIVNLMIDHCFEAAFTSEDDGFVLVATPETNGPIPVLINSHIFRAFIFSIQALGEDGVRIFKYYMATKSRIFVGSLLREAAASSPAQFSNAFLLNACQDMVREEIDLLVDACLKLKAAKLRFRTELLVALYKEGKADYTVLIRSFDSKEVMKLVEARQDLKFTNWAFHGEMYLTMLDKELSSLAHDPIGRSVAFKKFEERLPAASAGWHTGGNAEKIVALFEKHLPIEIVPGTNLDVARLLTADSAAGLLDKDPKGLHSRSELRLSLPVKTLLAMNAVQRTSWIMKKLRSIILKMNTTGDADADAGIDIDIFMLFVFLGKPHPHLGHVRVSAPRALELLLSSGFLSEYFSNVDDDTVLDSIFPRGSNADVTIDAKDVKKEKKRLLFSTISEYLLTIAIPSLTRPSLNLLYEVADAWTAMYLRVFNQYVERCGKNNPNPNTAASAWWSGFNRMGQALMTQFTRIHRLYRVGSNRHRRIAGFIAKAIFPMQLDGLKKMGAGMEKEKEKEKFRMDLVDQCVSQFFAHPSLTGLDASTLSAFIKSSEVESCLLDTYLPHVKEAVERKSVSEWFASNAEANNLVGGSGWVKKMVSISNLPLCKNLTMFLREAAVWMQHLAHQVSIDQDIDFNDDQLQLATDITNSSSGSSGSISDEDSMFEGNLFGSDDDSDADSDESYGKWDSDSEVGGSNRNRNRTDDITMEMDMKKRFVDIVRSDGSRQLVPVNVALRHSVIGQLMDHVFSVLKTLTLASIREKDDGDDEDDEEECDEEIMQMVAQSWRDWYERPKWMQSAVLLGEDGNAHKARANAKVKVNFPPDAVMVKDLRTRLERVAALSKVKAKEVEVVAPLALETPYLIAAARLLLDRERKDGLKHSTFYTEDIHRHCVKLGIADRVFEHESLAEQREHWIIRHSKADIGNPDVRKYLESKCIGVKDENERLAALRTLIDRSIRATRRTTHEVALTLEFVARRTVNEKGPNRVYLLTCVNSSLLNYIGKSFKEASKTKDYESVLQAATSLTAALTKMLENDVSKRDTVLKSLFKGMGQQVLTLLALPSEKQPWKLHSELKLHQIWCDAATKWVWTAKKTESGERGARRFKWPINGKPWNVVTATVNALDDASSQIVAKYLRPLLSECVARPNKILGGLENTIRLAQEKKQKQKKAKKKPLSAEECCSLLIQSLNGLNLNVRSYASAATQSSPLSLSQIKTLMDLVGSRWIEVPSLVTAVEEYMKPLRSMYESDADVADAKSIETHFRDAYDLFKHAQECVGKYWPLLDTIADWLEDLMKYVCVFGPRRVLAPGVAKNLVNDYLHSHSVRPALDMSKLPLDDTDAIFARACLLEHMATSSSSSSVLRTPPNVHLKVATTLRGMTQSAVHLDVVKSIYESSRDDLLGDLIMLDADVDVGIFSSSYRTANEENSAETEAEIDTEKRDTRPIQYVSPNATLKLRSEAVMRYGEMCLSNANNHDNAPATRAEWVLGYLGLPSTSSKDIIKLFTDYSDDLIVETVIGKLFNTDHFWFVLSHLLSPTTDLPPKMQRTVAELLNRLAQKVHGTEVVRVMGILLEPGRRKSLTVLLHKRILGLLFNVDCPAQAASVLKKEVEALHQEMQAESQSRKVKDVREELIRLAARNVWGAIDGKNTIDADFDTTLTGLCWDILEHTVSGIQTIKHSDDSDSDDDDNDIYLLLLAPYWAAYHSGSGVGNFENDNGAGHSRQTLQQHLSLLAPLNHDRGWRWIDDTKFKPIVKKSASASALSSGSSDKNKRLSKSDEAFMTVMKKLSVLCGQESSYCQLALNFDSIKCERYASLLNQLAANIDAAPAKSLELAAIGCIARTRAAIFHVPNLMGNVDLSASLHHSLVATIDKYLESSENENELIDRYLSISSARSLALFGAFGADLQCRLHGKTKKSEYVEYCKGIAPLNLLSAYIEKLTNVIASTPPRDIVRVFKLHTVVKALTETVVQFRSSCSGGGWKANSGSLSPCFVDLVVLEPHRELFELLNMHSKALGKLDIEWGR